jgi:hypothetical protein
VKAQICISLLYLCLDGLRAAGRSYEFLSYADRVRQCRRPNPYTAEVLPIRLVTNQQRLLCAIRRGRLLARVNDLETHAHGI